MLLIIVFLHWIGYVGVDFIAATDDCNSSLAVLLNMQDCTATLDRIDTVGWFVTADCIFLLLLEPLTSTPPHQDDEASHIN